MEPDDLRKLFTFKEVLLQDFDELCDHFDLYGCDEACNIGLRMLDALEDLRTLIIKGRTKYFVIPNDDHPPCNNNQK